jgi:hypothetical protein
LEFPPQSPPEPPQDTRREPVLTLPGALTAYVLLLAVIYMKGAPDQASPFAAFRGYVMARSPARHFDLSGSQARRHQPFSRRRDKL